ncbi:hypothetical protein ABZ479_01805 [Streptomyces sp. NPDC005722]
MLMHERQRRAPDRKPRRARGDTKDEWMTQIFFAATPYAAATVTAAIRAGLFGPRGGRRRLLVVSDGCPGAARSVPRPCAVIPPCAGWCAAHVRYAP